MTYQIGQIPTHNATPSGSNKIEMENPTGPTSEWCTLAEMVASMIAAQQQPTQGGRLTLQTGVPVMTTTQAAATTLFYTPFVHGFVGIYTGANVNMVPFTEISVATTDTTKNPAAIGASKVNDWYIWNDAGTLRLTHDVDWTSDIARAAGKTPVLVGGIYVNNQAITNGPSTNRGSWVGTTRSDASNKLNWIMAAADVAGVLGVWNAANQRLVQTRYVAGAATWTYSGAAIRQANADAKAQVSFVTGAAWDGFNAAYSIQVGGGASTGAFSVGCALDTTTAYTSVLCRRVSSSTTSAETMVAFGGGLPQLGYHTVSANEGGDGTNLFTMTGNSWGGLIFFGMF